MTIQQYTISVLKRKKFNLLIFLKTRFLFFDISKNDTYLLIFLKTTILFPDISKNNYFIH